MKKFVISLSLVLAFVFGLNAQVCYKVSGNGLDEPSFLYGTHHLAPLKVYNENAAATEAFTESKQVVGEIDMTINQMEMAMKMQPYMIAPTDSTLSKVLSPEDYEFAKQVFPTYSPQPGVAIEMLDMLKPMAITQMITLPMIMKTMPEYDPTQQLDTYFQKKGVEEGKKIIGLETIEHQADVLFNSHSIKKQAEGLMEALRNPDKISKEAKMLNDAYMTQDMTRMYEISKELEDDPVFFERLVVERNNNWIEQLPAIMNEGSAFVAVGCLHLVGEQGLVEQLRKLGYTIEPLR